MASSEQEFQPEPRMSWPDYVNDTDTIFIALHQRMSSLILYPEVSEYLSQLDQARYGKNDVDTAIDFCKFASTRRNPSMFEGVFRFLAREGVVVGVDKHDKDPRLDYPLRLHISLGPYYENTKLDELLKPVPTAIYSNNELDFPRCLKGTRTDLIEHVISKITSERPLDQPLLVAGSAGTGKSALAASVLQALKDQHFPVLSFVCKHDVPERANPQFVIPTLARQLVEYPSHRGGVEKALRAFKSELSNPVAVSPVHQVKLLTTVSSQGSPLQRPVILIDALDECGQTASRRQLIKVLIDNAKALCSRFTVIIVSRPIDQIEKSVRPRAWTVVDLDQLLQSEGTTADLKCFFNIELDELAPTSDQIHALVVAANGLFVWARVACSYIILLYDPKDARHALGGFCSGLAPTGSSEPLYELYRRTLRDYLFAGSSGMLTQNLELFHQVISSILFTEVALSAAGIAWLVDRSESAVEKLLRNLRPLLAPRDGSSAAPVRLLHASVDDFFRGLTDDDQFFVSSRHAQCFHRCFETMVAELCFNFAGVTDPRKLMRNRTDLEDLRASVSEPLKYACFQWAWHLSSLDSLEPSSLVALQHFFERAFLYWLEVVGVFDRVSEAAEWFRELAVITGDPLFEISNDASTFLRHYHGQVERSPCHIYVSALPLALQQSTIAKYYHTSFPHVTLPRIVIGCETSGIAPTLIHSSSVLSIEFSPIDDTVLTVTERTIKVFNSISAAQIAAFALPGSRFFRGYYSATGKTIVAHSKPNTLSLSSDYGSDELELEATLWDASTYKMTKLETKNNPYTTGFSLREYFPERHVALLEENKELIAVWDLELESPRRQELGELGGLGTVWASRDGSTVVVRPDRYDSKSVKLWRAKAAADSYVNVALPVFKVDEISDIAISSEGSRLAFGCAKEIVVVDLTLGSSLRVKTTDIYRLRFTADVSRIVTLSYEDVVTAFDLTGTMLWSSKQMPAYSLAVSRDGSRFAFVRSSDYSKVQICVAGQSTAEPKYDADHRIRSAHLFNDGQRLLTVADDGDVERWDPLTGTKLTSLAVPFEFYYEYCTMSPDGSLFAVFGFNDNVLCLDTSPGNVIWNKRYSKGSLPYYGLRLAFSPNNAFLVCAGRLYSGHTYSLVLLEAASGKLLEDSVLLDGRLKHIAFSANSSRICGVHHREDQVSIAIWTVNDSKPYLQLQTQSSSTIDYGDKDSNYQVLWTAADTKVVIITSSPEPTLTCWDPNTCTRLAVVRISVPKLSEYGGGDLAMLANLVGPVFGGLELPPWLAESTDQVIEYQDSVQHRSITLLNRWWNLVFIPAQGGNERFAEHEYPNGSKMEVVGRSGKAIVIQYPSEDPWAHFCKSMVGFRMPEGKLLLFFKVCKILATNPARVLWTVIFQTADQDKQNSEVPSTPLSEQDSTTEDPSSSANDHPINVETSAQSVSNDSSVRLLSPVAATASHGSGFQMPEGKLVPIVKQARPDANEAFTSLFEEDSVGENLPYPVNDHHTDVETPARPAFNESGAQLTSLIAATSSHASINTLKQGQASVSKKQGWRERLGIKSSKNKDKGKGKAD